MGKEFKKVLENRALKDFELIISMEDVQEASRKIYDISKNTVHCLNKITHKDYLSRLYEEDLFLYCLDYLGASDVNRENMKADFVHKWLEVQQVYEMET